MNLVSIEHIIAIVGGIIVAVTSAIALKNDWHSTGIDNQVFKLMLGLLCIGAIVAVFAGVGWLGHFPTDGAA